MTPNLADRSKCSSSPSVLIVNTETNDQDYTIYTWWPTEVYITPKKLMDDVVIYMSDAFNRIGIKTNQTSTKVIQISMEKIGNSYSFLNYTAEAQLKIILPEKKYTRVYSHSDTTPKGLPIATAYTIHAITWQIINDPVIQDYLLCTDMAANAGLSSGNTALDILKKRYATGEITKDQYEQMKKDIQ